LIVQNSRKPILLSILAFEKCHGIRSLAEANFIAHVQRGFHQAAYHIVDEIRDIDVVVIFTPVFVCLLELRSIQLGKQY
jgi:hypothetical protein